MIAGRTASTFGTGHRVFLASSVQRDALFPETHERERALAIAPSSIKSRPFKDLREPPAAHKLTEGNRRNGF